MLGNGSDELIQIILMSVALPGAAVLAPTPTFVMYEMISRFVGMRFIGVPLTNGFELDGPAVQAAVANENPAVIFLAYPNNPTGNLFSREAVLSVIKTAPGLVVLDEAYHAFAQDSFMSELLRFDNLLVMRTLSKQGLAGLRLGALAGRPEWLKEFDKVRLPYNINSLTQASAEFALRHASALDAQATRLREAREALYASLKTMPELEAWPSRANFILFRVKSRSATEVFEAL
jgi:histidinol-phosphate aminotransferase